MFTEIIVQLLWNRNPAAMALGSQPTDKFDYVGEPITYKVAMEPNMDAWYRAMCEKLFAACNGQNDKGDPQGDNRSMSVGDRILFTFGDGEVRYECKNQGWEKV